MQGNMSKPLTHKAAARAAAEMGEGQVYVHASSGKLCTVSPKGRVRLLGYEEACELAVYIGFTPTPHSSYLVGNRG